MRRDHSLGVSRTIHRVVTGRRGTNKWKTKWIHGREWRKYQEIGVEGRNVVCPDTRDVNFFWPQSLPSVCSHMVCQRWYHWKCKSINFTIRFSLVCAHIWDFKCDLWKCKCTNFARIRLLSNVLLHTACQRCFLWECCVCSHMPL